MISEQQKQNIFELRQKGKGILEISIILKLGKATVYEWCNRFDPEKKYNLTNKFDKGIKNEIIEMYLKVGNLKKVSDSFPDIPKITLRNILIKSGKYKKKQKETAIGTSRRKSLHVINWKRDKKLKLIEYKGGKCEICGYSKYHQAFDFHHIEQDKKDFNISSNSYSFERMKKEADKCMLLCANCHRELHANKFELP